MNCPNCVRDLKDLVVDQSHIQTCDGGCGGIWFDSHELDRIDSAQESVDSRLLDIPVDPGLSIDPTAKKKCPCCAGQTMMKRGYSARQEVEVDECPRCGGIWLDHGELEKIRGQFATDEDRTRALSRVSGRFEVQLADMTADERQKVGRRSKLFGFLTSYFSR